MFFRKLFRKRKKQTALIPPTVQTIRNRVDDTARSAAAHTSAAEKYAKSVRRLDENLASAKRRGIPAEAHAGFVVLHAAENLDKSILPPDVTKDLDLCVEKTKHQLEDWGIRIKEAQMGPQ